MPNIEAVLDKGGTAATDFTLHDAGHSFRVAQKMAEIMPSDVLQKLSTFELALLLLAAYVHDIGMTPEQRRVRDHYDYLLTGANSLTDAELVIFQKWLDDRNREVTIPLCAAAPTREQLNVAEEVITHYCRDQHNDWSAEWIRKELASLTLGSYSGWVDDLVVLCKSHHMGYYELRGPRFDPRYVGSPASVVHLRYLACVLRVADVLDVDPERTPDVILRHRDVAPASFIYWWKDHQISIIRQGDRFVISARPPNAQVHRAVEITANQIEEELRLCRRLADETHFEKYPGPAPSDLPHRWLLLADLHRDIAPRDDAYEYIDGGFRPNTQKLLSLLSGRELYESPLVAIRELLQNAFDAVREQIAYERLNQPNPSDPSHEIAFGKQNHVKLSLECGPDGEWLVCVDTGVGMSKAVIQDHVLVSGTPKRHDILDLERRCTAAGFSLGRTGEFGIGVLTYFMLADRVVIRTCRSQECADAEGHGWQFETEGIGSFGELKRMSDRKRGTEVRLHLRAGLLGKTLSGSARHLAAYVRVVLVHVPCEFVLSPVQCDSEGLRCSPGWVRTDDDFSNELMEQLFQSDSARKDVHLLPASRRKEQESAERYRQEVRSEASRLLRWETHEGTLPNGIGRYRFHLPYFLLRAGASLGYMRVRQTAKELRIERVGGRDVFRLSEHLYAWTFAWNGMSVRADRYSGRISVIESVKHLSTGYVEIDLAGTEKGIVSVSRAEARLSHKSLIALRWLDQRIGEICEGFLDKHAKSHYAALNYRIVASPEPPKSPLRWLTPRGGFEEKHRRWKRMEFPFTNEPTLTAEGFGVEGLRVKFRGRHVSLASPLRETSYSDIRWYNSAGAQLDKVVVNPTYWLTMAPLWGSSRAQVVPLHGAKSCRLPPNWRRLCGVLFGRGSALGARVAAWNVAHPLLRSIDLDGLAWCEQTFRSSLDPLPHKAGLLAATGRCAAWIMRCLDIGAADLWDGLRERDPSLLPEVLGRVLRGGPKTAHSPELVLLHWYEDTLDSLLRVLSPEGWRVYRVREEKDEPQIEHYLPDPGPDWRLEINITEKVDPNRPPVARRRSPSPEIPKRHWWFP
jgi:hypothetical protein